MGEQAGPLSDKETPRSIVPSGFEATAHPVFLRFEAPRPPTDTLPRDTPEQSLDRRCPICLLSFTSPVTLILCRHTFCAACLKRWFRIKLTCPICKSEETDFIRDPEIVEGRTVWNVFRIRVGKRKRRWASGEIERAVESHKSRVRPT